jgi:hypothetical protein
MHALLDSVRDTADIVFIVTSNVHDARSKALIDVADSVMLEVVQGVSSYRDLYKASNDYALVADKLLGVVYVASASSRGRNAGPSAIRTDIPVWDTGEQASPGKTTSVEPWQSGDVSTPRLAVASEHRSESEIAPVENVAPDHAKGPHEETFDLPPWSNGAVGGIAADERTPSSVTWLPQGRPADDTDKEPRDGTARRRPKHHRL